MSHISTQVNVFDGLTVTYFPVRPSSFPGEMLPASISVDLNGGYARLSLSMEDARLLAEQLPGLVMAHDATERDAKVRATAITEAA